MSASGKRAVVLLVLGLSLGGLCAVVISHHVRAEAAGHSVSWLPWED